MQVIIGIIMMAAGGFMAIKSEVMLDFFGRIEFFEDKLASSGGSRLGYKMVGLIVFFLGMLTATGLIMGFLEFVLAPVLKYSNTM